MKFSVLIPIIKKDFLKISIESVLSQAFSDWQLILYNDCSKDDIDKIVDEYRNDKRIIYLKGDKNMGAVDPSLVWNKMLNYADGDYICLLGDDDCLSPNFLSEMNGLILDNKEQLIFRAKLKRIDEENNVIYLGKDLPKIETWDQFLYERNVNGRAHSTSEFILNRKALLDVGGYVNFPRACGSDDATYLILAKEKGIASTNKTFACWRKSSLNISDNDSEDLNRKKAIFYLEWEINFLDEIFSKEIPAHFLYNSIERRINLYKEIIEKPDIGDENEIFIVKFFKKYFNILLNNSKLRQPARKVWYFVRNKKIKE